MAKIEFKGITAYQKQLEQLGKVGADKAIRYAIYPAAKIVIEEIKERVPVDTGDLRDSIILTPMRDDGGYINTKVEFAGYDSKGAPNAVKAAVLEHGRSGGVGKHPFIRNAVRAAQDRAVAAMQHYLDEYLEKFMNTK